MDQLLWGGEYPDTPEGSKTYQGQFGPDVYTDRLIDFMERHKDQPMALYFAMALTHTPFVPTPDEPDASGKMGQHKAIIPPGWTRRAYAANRTSPRG